jgi:putative DNA primase/helicase
MAAGTCSSGCPKGAIVTSRNGWRPGVDIKAEGNYVILAPSLHESGRRYKWERPLPEPASRDAFAPLPAAWLSILPPRDRRGPSPAKRSAGSTSDSRDSRTGQSDSPAEPYTVERGRLVFAALTFLSAIERDPWRDIGMALKTTFGERGWAFFDVWSENALEKYDARENRRQWDSFRCDGTGLTLGTLLYRAKDAGWNGTAEHRHPASTMPDFATWAPVAGADQDEQRPAGRGTRSPASATAGERHPGEFNAAAAAPDQLTDVGNARRLVARHGGNVRFVHGWGKWLIWCDPLWREDKDGEIVRLAKETIKAMAIEALATPPGIEKKKLLAFASRSEQAPRIAAMIELAKPELEVATTPDKLDADPSLLCAHNGVMDLRSCTYRPARREDYLTMQAGTAFDAAAVCPTWLAFIDKITAGERELAAFLQRMVGYMLTGSVAEEILFVFWGSGNNGKSTFRETLSALLGDYAIASDAALLMDRRQHGATPEVARLKGRRLVCINETAEGGRLNEARAKLIAGNDTMNARHLYGEPFDFKPTHKPLLTTNHKPKVRGRDLGIWRRISLVPFTVSIPTEEVVLDFHKRLLIPELAGILNWALDGLRSYRTQGLALPAAVREATKRYREEQDIVAQWLDERCVVDPSGKVHAMAAHADFKTWATMNGEQSMSQRSLTASLLEVGGGKFIKKRGTDGPRVIHGLRLRPMEEG